MMPLSPNADHPFLSVL